MPHRTFPQKVVIAPDSFKESLAASGVAHAIASGLCELWPDTELLCLPMADGGEGTVAAVIAATGGRTVPVEATDPLGDAITAHFGLLPDNTTAIVEVAAASGLELVAPSDRNPLLATSFGTGELILAAARTGVRRCVIGIGGSATVDGGAGLLQALGVRLLDASGEPIPRGGAGLIHLRHIDLSTLNPALRTCDFEVACDVDNPLTGPHGAAAIFGPQKGATAAMIPELEAGLANFARVLASDLGIHIAQTPGAGAAGGIGAALIACLGAQLRPGVDLIAELVQLEAALHNADLVVTGEGRIDAQTARGKTPVGVARLAKQHGIPVIALAGSIGPGAETLSPHGIDAIFPILPGLCTREQAFADAAENLRRTARSVAALWTLARSR
jgi:glycerate kinase